MRNFAGIMLAAAAVFMAACTDPFEDFEDELDDAVVNSENYLSSYMESLNDYGAGSSSSTKSSSSEASSSSEKSSSSAAQSSSSEGGEESSSAEGESSSSAAASSSSGVSYTALSEERTISFELYEYEQVSANWDGSGDDDYEDGDPKISFTIFLIDGSDTTTLETGDLLELEDTGTWSGSAVYEGTVPAGTSVISVCPSVLDVDELSDDDKSSGNCVSVYNVGTLLDEAFVYQSDKTDDYELYWDWFLFEDIYGD